MSPIDLSKRDANDLAGYVRQLREERELSLSEVATRAGLKDKYAIWKLENGDSGIRPSTLRSIGIDGLNLKQDSRQYLRLVALWMEHRGMTEGMDIANAIDEMRRSSKLQHAKVMQEIDTIYSSMKKEDRETLMAGLRHVDARQAMLAVARSLVKK